MTTTPRRIARPDDRQRIRIPALDNSREYAVDPMPGGAFLISPCTVVTDFERELRKRVPDLDEALREEGRLHSLPEGQSWDDAE